MSGLPRVCTFCRESFYPLDAGTLFFAPTLCSAVCKDAAEVRSALSICCAVCDMAITEPLEAVDGEGDTLVCSTECAEWWAAPKCSECGAPNDGGNCGRPCL